MVEIQAVDVGDEVDSSSWPKGVRGITIGEMDKIGVDGDGRLYWDGKQIEISKRLDLSKGERWFALIVGAFAIFGSIGAVAQGWAAAHQWSCQTKIASVGCS